MLCGFARRVFSQRFVDNFEKVIVAEEKSKKIFYLLTSVVLLCGIVSAAAGGVVLNFKEVGHGGTKRQMQSRHYI